jgi:TonB family protein
MAAFVGVAVGLHLLVLPTLGDQVVGLGRALRVKSSPVRVAPLNPATLDALRRNREAMARARTQAMPEAATPKPAEPQTGEEVDVAPSADRRAPDSARFSAEHNSRVERETKSRHAQMNPENVTSKPTSTIAGNVEAPIVQQGKEGRAGHGSSASPLVPGVAPEVPFSRPRDRLALRLQSEDGTLHSQEGAPRLDGTGKRLRLGLAPSGSEGAKPDSTDKSSEAAAELFPKLSAVGSLAGAPLYQKLDDVEEGEGTFLNTREFKYAGFYNRFRREMINFWHPFDEWRRRDPTGNIYGSRERMTVVTITLKPDGSLRETQILQSSGIDFFDQGVLAAVRRGQPYPNPPKGMIGPDGNITFEFGFSVTLDGRFRGF